MPFTIVVFWCLLVFIICRVLVWLLSLAEKVLLSPADGEPPLVQSSIPFIGHVIGLIRYGVSYYRQLREQNPQPIFTIWLATQKVYVVNSPALVSQVNRRQQQIDSNAPFLAVVMGGLFGLHGEDLGELLRNPGAPGSLRNDSKVVEHSHLERGTASLDDIFRGLMVHVVSRIGDLGAREDSAAAISLEHWLRDTFTVSAAYGVFGEHNPLARDPELCAEFWTFEKGMKELVIGFLPSLTAAEPARARQRLTDAFAHFVQDEAAVEGASELIRALRSVAMAHHRDAEYLARYLLALFSAFILNTVPVAFWTLAHIYSDGALLQQIRAELDHVVRKTATAEGLQLELDMAALRAQKCPLFTSTFREVLRYVGASRGIMAVHEDVWIESHQERHLLRRGAQVQISATAMHADPAIWGADAAAFNPGRFLHETAMRGKDKVHPAAHRTFGGGSTLCPGRHLATDEVLALAAMFLTSFEMEPAGDGANSLLPSRNDRDMTPIVKPMSDIKVRLSRRAAMENSSWSLKPTE